MPVLTTTIDDSPSVAVAIDRLLDDLGGWISYASELHAVEFLRPGHDQATFTTCWGPHVRARGDRRSVEFMRSFRDRIRDAHVEDGHWRHGYWHMNEAHHGTEHFELFLGALWRLAPDDEETVRQLVDAAEHLGNWSTEVPPWFDWETGLYLSQYFGADGTIPGKWLSINESNHVRCVNIALLAHEMTGEERYLELATRHGGLWADAIAGNDAFPIGLRPGEALYGLSEEMPAEENGRMPHVARQPQTPIRRAEAFLASGTVEAMLKLWGITRECRYLHAARRLLDILATQVGDPDAGCGVHAIRHHRDATGDAGYDEAILAAAEALDAYGFSELGMEPAPPLKGHQEGIGKRADMADWYEGGAPRTMSPVLLGMAAELRDDERLATRALDLGRAYFRLAREAYPANLHHGCGSRSVSAIARGHGRDNNTGVITGVLEPLMERFG